MNDVPSHSDEAQPNEIDEQFRALLEGLRTTLPGVQVLFAFLLILPFQNEFSRISATNRYVYYTAFLASAVASVFLIAPSVHQRVRAPISGFPRRSTRHVHIANWFAIVGTAAFLVALVATVFMVSLLVIDDTAAAIAATVIAAAALWTWVYVPLVTFQRVR